MQSVLFEKTPSGVGILTMNRPQVRNALNWEAQQSFADSIETIRSDSELRVLIIQGTQGAFCSGGDLSELHHHLTRLDGVRLTTIMGDALVMLDELPIPTIAAIEGPAMGGGAEIALACDIRVMAEQAVLGLMHVRLAIIPAWGGGQRLMRLVGYSRAIEWLSVGKLVRAQEAIQSRLADHVVAEGEALTESRRIADGITERSPLAVAAVKRVLRDGRMLDYQQALQSERDAFPDLWESERHIAASERFISRKNHKPA
jgi:enoyl-CoA hydratase/carnithine racemase